MMVWELYTVCICAISVTLWWLNTPLNVAWDLSYTSVICAHLVLGVLVLGLLVLGLLVRGLLGLDGVPRHIHQHASQLQLKHMNAKGINVKCYATPPPQYPPLEGGAFGKDNGTI